MLARSGSVISGALLAGVGVEPSAGVGEAAGAGGAIEAGTASASAGAERRLVEVVGGDPG